MRSRTWWVFFFAGVVLPLTGASAALWWALTAPGMSEVKTLCYSALAGINLSLACVSALLLWGSR